MVINRKSVRTALRTLNDLFTLGKHPLAWMETVTVRLSNPHSSNPASRGLILRKLLLDAIEEMRPPNREPDPHHKSWRSWHILYLEYIDGFNHAYVAVQLGNLPRRTYMHNKGLALDRLASILLEHENEITQPMKPPVPHPTPSTQPQYKLVKDMVRSKRWDRMNGIMRPDELSIALITDFDDAPKVSCDVTLRNFSIEWTVIIHGRAGLMTVGNDKKWYWIGFYPAEKQVRIQIVDNQKWSEVRTFYISEVYTQKPNRVKVEQQDGFIRISINDTFNQPNSEYAHTFPDSLFDGESIPLHVGLGISVFPQVPGTIIAKGIAIFQHS